ncbi:MAG TPA: hypothetical protein VJ835_10895 [Fimbriimonadaceae bacterium]|nr:hypothetical protein [Fimbriimonadaceae bacterium]
MGQKVIGIVVAIISAAVAYFVVGRSMRGSVDATQLHDAPAANLETGWIRAESARAKFTINLPGSYVAFDPESPDAQTTIEKVSATNPTAGMVLQQAKQQTQFVFWAFDIRDVTKFANNVNVSVQPRQNKPANQSQLDSEKGNLESKLPPGGRVVGLKMVDLPAGKAILSQMELQIDGPQGSYTSFSNGYVVSIDDQDVTITFTCLASDADKFQPIVEKAMQSLRPLKT